MLQVVTKLHSSRQETLLTIKTVLAAAAVLSVASSAAAEPKPSLVIDRSELHVAKALTVSSSDFASGEAIPLADSAYGASKSPPLQIAGAPASTKSYVILMEDPDSQRNGEPILHWFVYNLSGDVAALPGDIPEGASLTAPVSMMQAPNVAGRPAYRGPHPPIGDAHHYHVEVFALDTTLPTSLSDRTTLVGAMVGHVLAEGELLGTFTAPNSPPKIAQ